MSRTEGSVCVDCLMFLANGDTPQELDEAGTEKWVAEFVRRTEGTHIFLAGPEDCEGWFSWSPCDACGSPLGGDRHPVVFELIEQVTR